MSALSGDGVATLPAGSYWVGDPCYSIPRGQWHEWLEAADYTNETVKVAAVNGHLCVGINTEFGDGTYHGDDGGEYPVDSGMIGLVPVKLGPTNSGTTIETFPEEFECYREGSVIVLGHVRIETGDVPGECFACGQEVCECVCDDCGNEICTCDEEDLD